MDTHRGAIALAIGALGFSFGLGISVADLHYLGIPCGAAALVAGFLAYVISNSQVRNESEVEELKDEVTQLEAAVASQIQARLAAEQQAAEAEAGLAHAAHPAIVGGISDPEQALTDELTGLFSEAYFTVTVDARISSARRHLRPVAVVLVDVVEGLPEGTPRQADPVAVADGVTQTVREADTTARLRDGRFGLILEDTPENGAIWTVERLRRCLASDADGLTVWAGIACYPAHAFDAAEILSQASRALEHAREWHQDRIEVAEPL